MKQRKRRIRGAASASSRRRNFGLKKKRVAFLLNHDCGCHFPKPVDIVRCYMHMRTFVLVLV